MGAFKDFFDGLAEPFQMSLEELRQKREAEANDPNYVSWQEQANIGNTTPNLSNTWREDGEAAWDKRVWFKWWLNYIKTGKSEVPDTDQ